MSAAPDDLAGLLVELRGWVEGTALSDDANRKIWLMHKAADAIDSLQRQLSEARAACQKIVDAVEDGDEIAAIEMARAALSPPSRTEE